MKRTAPPRMPIAEDRPGAFPEPSGDTIASMMTAAMSSMIRMPMIPLAYCFWMWPASVSTLTMTAVEEIDMTAPRKIDSMLAPSHQPIPERSRW